jgi:hypothetical protein
MNNGSINLKAKSVIRRSRIIAGLLIFGSLAGILGGAAAVNRTGAAEFFARFSSPKAILLLGLFYLIYLPASLRIYYILLLNTTGVFTAEERRYYQEGKRKWEKYLFRAALLAGILVVWLAVMLRLSR